MKDFYTHFIITHQQTLHFSHSGSSSAIGLSMKMQPFHYLNESADRSSESDDDPSEMVSFFNSSLCSSRVQLEQQ